MDDDTMIAPPATTRVCEEGDLPENAVVMDEILDVVASVGKYTGQVKWWNDKLGFGFATICDGAERGRDIFVHHTGIRPANSNYRTLRKGEYVNFNITNGHNGQQAVDVTGICGGMLMCDVAAAHPPSRQK
jgi:cold shock CspA family protein